MVEDSASVDSRPETAPLSQPPVPRGPLAPFVIGYHRVMRGIHFIGWGRIRWALAAVYAVYLADLLITDGVPTDREELSILVVLGLAIASLGRGWRRLLGIGVDWLPFTLVLMCYDRSRAVADTVGMPLHEEDVAAVEKWLFGGHVPTVWLQQHLYDPLAVHWYDALCTLVYSSHFIVTPLLAAVFWLRTRRMFIWFISRVIVLSFAGLVTYVLFPEAPPWLAAKDGFIDPVLRISARGWQYFRAGFAERALASGQQGGSNPVAAMPSLHFAFAVLAVLALAELTRSRWRALLALYPLAMGFTLIYTGEHYVIDLVAGLVYAYAIHWGLTRLARANAARRTARAGTSASATGPAESSETAESAGTDEAAGALEFAQGAADETHAGRPPDAGADARG